MSTENSGIPEEYMKYFTKADTIKDEYIVNIWSIGAWALICLAVFVETDMYFSKKAKKSSYIILFFTCAMIPLTIFAYKIYNAYHRSKVKDRPYAAPDFGVCFIPWVNLTEREKKAGVIGAIDMECNKMNQSNFSFSVSKALQQNTYYLVYTMFTLTLLFFPLPENYPFNKNSPLIKMLMQINMLVVLALLSSPVFMGRTMRQVGFTLDDWFYNLTIMSATLTIMTIAFIVNQLLIKG